MRCFPLFLLCLFIFQALQSCAQVKNTVVNTSAYYMIPTPGIVAVDEKGHELRPQRDSVFYVYVETKGDNIAWERAWKGNRSFSVIPARLKQPSVQVGKSVMDNHRIELSPASGNTLWQIELSDNRQHQQPPKSVAPHEILLMGKAAGQPVFVTVKSLTQLASPEYQ